MKQFLFMAVTMFLGTAGSFGLSPVYGVAVYYLYAVLRPQFIWEWVELFGIQLGEVNWSLPVALCTLVATLVWRAGLWTPVAALKAPWYGNPALTRSHCLFLAFTGWICLTFVTAQSHEVAWPNFVEYAKIFVMFVCAALVLRTVRDLWVVYFVILGAAAYIAYEINFYYLAYQWIMVQHRGYGGLDNNGAALILAMGIPLAFFAWEATPRWWRWGYMAAIPVLGHAVMLTYSRGAMVSLIPCAVLMWVRARNKSFMTVAYLIGFVLLVTLTGKEVEERFASVGTENTNPRWATWKVAVKMANDRPVFGFGIRCSPLFIGKGEYVVDVPNLTIHSQYLQLAADSGWPALALYAGLLGSVLIGLWQTRRALRKFTDPDTQDVRSLAAGLECALVLFCVGATFLSLEHFEMPYIVILLAVQLHAITRAVAAKLEPTPSGLPPLTMPYPYPAVSRPVPVSP